MPRFFFRCLSAGTLCCLLTFSLQAAPGRYSDLNDEYNQVRKIALRDLRVREAFTRASERLDSRIIELDPALAAMVRAHPSGTVPPISPVSSNAVPPERRREVQAPERPRQARPPESHPPEKAREVQAAPPPAPVVHKPKPPAPAAVKAAPAVAKAKAPSDTAFKHTHTVAFGETLSSIAGRYGVSVSKLQTVNHIEDARKLQAGQTLSVP